MFKAVITVKRKSGMSMEDFIDYYETKHAPLGASKLPNLLLYTRRYVTPVDADNDAPFDVITEIGFENQAEFEKALGYLVEPETQSIITRDEENLFERGTITFYTVDERGSDLAHTAAG